MEGDDRNPSVGWIDRLPCDPLYLRPIKIEYQATHSTNHFSGDLQLEIVLMSLMSRNP
jgi:hypothetical protein